MSRFTDDTAVTPLGDGRYSATIHDRWWIQRGPNGGYLAAIVLRSVIAEVADDERRPRSVTLHYLRPPEAGACEVAVTIERAGRGMSTVTARLAQDGKDCVLATVALGVDREGPELDEHPMPDVPPPEEVEVVRRPDDPGPDIPFRGRFEMRPVLGARPFELGTEAVTGGWIRTTDHDPVDAVLLTAIMDSWPPAIFSRLEGPVGVPTVDLTVHLRRRPTPGDDWVLVRFRTTVAAEGFLEEDGEAWSRDGRLIAHARQLGVLVP